MAPTCTDPNLNTTFAADEDGGVMGPLPDTFRYPSRKGWDEFFGYGRLDAYKSVEAAAAGLDPAGGRHHLAGMVPADGPAAKHRSRSKATSTRAASYTCRVEVAPGAQPNNRTTAGGGDFASVAVELLRRLDGALERLQRPARRRQHGKTLEAMFPKDRPDLVQGNENGGGAERTDLERAPQHAALRVHRAPGRRRTAAGRARARR